MSELETAAWKVVDAWLMFEGSNGNESYEERLKRLDVAIDELGRVLMKKEE